MYCYYRSFQTWRFAVAYASLVQGADVQKRNTCKKMCSRVEMLAHIVGRWAWVIFADTCHANDARLMTLATLMIAQSICKCANDVAPMPPGSINQSALSLPSLSPLRAPWPGDPFSISRHILPRHPFMAPMSR